MGTLFSTFDIARSGLQTAQTQIEVAGHNIANVNREGYSRQRAEVVNKEPLQEWYGGLGRGVEVVGVERLRDTFLDYVYRQQSPGLGSAELRATYFSRIEDLFQEPGERGFGVQLDSFFDSLHDFANNVEEQPVRMSVITEAQSISSSLNLIAGQVYALRTNANEEVRNMVSEINSIGTQVATLNGRIAEAEIGGRSANDLRDERDLLLDELSSFVNITYRERTSGEVDVLIGGAAFVEGSYSRQLSAVIDPTLDPTRPDLVKVVFSDSGIEVTAENGSLYGALSIRDQDLVDLADRLDVLASTIIGEINRIHSSSNGIENWSGTITGTNAATDPAMALTSGGLPFEVTAGTLDLVIYDSSNTATTHTITIDGTTTLQDLAAELDALGNFSASVTVDNTLQVQADSGYTFAFSNDQTGALSALGVNGLFTGYKAANIGVNQDILNNPRLLASGSSLDVLETGDNTAALAMANVRRDPVLENGTASVSDYYESMIVRVGVNANANTQTLEMQQRFVDDFQRRRQEVSGVAIDEEVTYMLQFQRAYEASARVISVVDKMIDALFNAYS